MSLGHASTYAVLSGASVGNTVNAPDTPYTTLRGDLGVNASAQPTGFPPGIVTGTTRVGAAAAPAYTDLVAAYEEVAERTGGTAIAGDLAGVTLSPGLYAAAGAVSNTGTVTLDAEGNPNAVFVLQIGGALTMAAGAQVKLTEGAQASNVFWQVEGATAIGAGDKFAGTVMALAAIAVGAGTQFNGRALALTGAISLNSDEFYSAPPVVTIAGGAVAFTDSPDPTISGSTDVEAPGVVSVTIAGQLLTATPSDGAWSVTPSLIADGAHQVTASVIDGAGNTGSAAQQLNIETVAPVVSIDGGSSVTTNDPTPTIAGGTDAAPGSVVTVTVDAQTLTALVQPAGTWNVLPTTLGDGTHTVTTSVADPAGNVGSASQALTIETVAPIVAISGGASATTSDLDPTIAGSSNAAPGTTITVSIAGQTLTTLLQASGTWEVTPSPLGEGIWSIIASATDPAGNVGIARQTLAVVASTPGAGAPGAAGIDGLVGTTGAAGTSGPTGADGARTAERPLTLRLSAASYKDPRGRQVRVPFVLGNPARVTLIVLRGKAVVAELSDARRAAGRGLISWNGRARRKLLARGAYELILQAVSPGGETVRETAKLRIT